MAVFYSPKFIRETSSFFLHWNRLSDVISNSLPMPCMTTYTLGLFLYFNRPDITFEMCTCVCLRNFLGKIEHKKGNATL